MFRDEFVLKKRVFDEHSAHSKAVLDDSLITVDTTAHHLIKGLAKKAQESHNSRIALSTVILAFPTHSLLGLQIFELLYDLCTRCDETAKEFTSFASAHTRYSQNCK